MWKAGLAILLLTAACNLSNRPVVTRTVATAIVSITSTPIVTSPVILTPLVTVFPSPNPLNTLCQLYITYSGSDPANKLSLRAQPSVSAIQILKLPNNAQVYLVPGSQEIEAEGYHWLNIIYVDSFQNRYEGWTARDSYSVGGVRNASIATLRATGQQAAC